MISTTQEVSALVATYTNNTRFDSRHCAVLAAQLRRSAPADLTEVEATALEAMERAASHVTSVRLARLRVSPPALRVPRQELVTSWTALYSMLSALASVPGEAPQALEAARLNALLFAEGTEYTNLDAAALWDYSKVVLQRIEEESLRPALEALVPKMTLDAIDTSVANVANAIGVVGPASDLPVKRALAEARLRFSFAVATYARALSLRIVLDDATTVARFRAAIAPVDGLRVVLTRGRSDDDDLDVLEEETEEPTTPNVEEPTEPELPDDPEINPFVTA
ncbi:MAG: hypothetical protein H6721_32765 [Sandaracinus sp.]|nr:hypothetical protein [Sandaracinus sp.]